MQIADLETIDPSIAQALASLGITDTRQFLSAAGPASGRSDLAHRSGVAPETLLRLANWFDLMRQPKLVEGYCVLLDALDLGSRPKLAGADAGELLRALRRKNVELTAVRSIQPESILADWINAARDEGSLVET
jgi:hypothetical protein